jgi:hypothetical protein
VDRGPDLRLVALLVAGGVADPLTEPVELAVPKAADELRGVVEVRVGEGLAHPGLGGDALHGDGPDPALDEEGGGAVQELLAAEGAGQPAPSVRGAAHGLGSSGGAHRGAVRPLVSKRSLLRTLKLRYRNRV